MSSSAVAWKTWEGHAVEGKFPLRQWLGGSEHSVVFLTELPGRQQRAAIKLVTVDPSESNLQLARWAEIARLSHPHLIRIFESGRCQLDGMPFLYAVMEYAEEDLSQILPQRALTPAEVTDLLPPLLDALAYLHARGFVHGRLKPSNVLAVGDQLKLTSDQILTAKDASSGRRRRDVYDAPETAAGIVWAASDIWSVGATLVATLMQNARLIPEGTQADPGLPASMPEPYRGIARECLHFDPKRRCSIADIMARLQPVGRSVPAEPVVIPPPLPEKRSSVGPTMAGALIVAVLIGFAFFLFRGKAPESSSAPASSQPVAASRPAQPAQRTTEPASPPATTTQAKPPASRPSTLPAPAPPASKAVAPNPKREFTPAPVGSGGVAVHQVLPDVPRSARNTISGKIRVSVRVDVDPSGKVTDAKLTSPGPSRYFAKLALNAARGWEFTPPQVSGQPAASAWILHYRFGRTRTEVSPERVTH